GQALTLVWQHLQALCPRGAGIALAIPSYLSPEQVQLLTALAEKAGLAVLGSVAAPLAAALAAYAAHPWDGTARVVDADDHAVTLPAVTAGGGRAEVVAGRSLPHLGLRAWRERLLDGVADRCILKCRRDPRDSATAEQLLFEQLDAVVDAGRQGR